MKKISAKKFSKEHIQLDGNSYDGCTFESCTFVYDATADFELANSAISSDCRFLFRHAAGSTLNTLKAIYSMGSWGRSQVIATLQNVAPDLKNLH